MTQSIENRQEKAIVPQNNKIKSKMKILGKILTSAGCMILGYYLILGALAIHPYLGGIVIGIALFAIGDIIRDKY